MSAYLEMFRRIERQYCQDHHHTPQKDRPLQTRGLMKDRRNMSWRWTSRYVRVTAIVNYRENAPGVQWTLASRQ